MKHEMEFLKKEKAINERKLAKLEIDIRAFDDALNAKRSDATFKDWNKHFMKVRKAESIKCRIEMLTNIINMMNDADKH